MANETTAMTGPQQRVVELVTKHGELEVAHLKRYGLDPRAANNLVKARVLTLTGGVYRLREQKKAEPASEKAPKGAKDKAAEVEGAPESAVVPVVLAPEAAEEAEPAEDETAEPAEAEPAEVERAEVEPAEVEAEAAEPKEAAEPAEPKEAEEPTTVKEGPRAAEAASATAAEPKEAAKPSKPSKPTKAPKPAKPPKPAKAAVVVNPTGECLCGCGMQIGEKRRFVIGHDARLHSLALRVHRGKADKAEIPTTEATLNYLRGAPWMTDEMRASLSL